MKSTWQNYTTTSPSTVICVSPHICLAPSQTYALSSKNTATSWYCNVKEAFQGDGASPLPVKLTNVAQPGLPTPNGACYRCRVSSVTLRYNCAQKRYQWSFGLDVQAKPGKCPKRSVASLSFDENHTKIMKSTPFVGHVD